MTRSTMRLLAGFGFAALAAVTFSGQAAAQGTAPAAPGSPKLVATWEGPYATDGPSGTMSLKVVREGEAWKVVTALGGDAPPPGEPTEVTASGNTISWRQQYGEYDVVFKATLSEDGNTLSGTLEASQGGSYVGGGSFTLTKKA